MNNNCTLCSLRSLTTKPIFGKGNIKSKILIIGEAPGREEELSGIPFVGRAGKLLDEILESANISKEDVYITNTICCRPPNNNIHSKDAQIALKTCPKAYLFPLISNMSPKIIITLGNISYRVLFNSEGILKKRGILRSWNGIKVIPTLHPAFLLRGNMQYLSDVIKDFKLANQEDLISTKTFKTIVSKEEDLLKLYEEIKKSKKVSCDIETSGLNVYLGAKIIGIGFSYNRNTGFYIKIREKSIIGNSLELCVSSKILNIIKQILEDTSISKTFHNALFDVEFLKQDLKIDVKYINADSLILSHLLDENSSNRLEYLTNIYYPDLVGYKDISNALFKKYGNFDKLPLQVIADRCCNDTIATFRLTEDLTKEIKKDSDLYLYYKRFHLELLPTILRIQERGFKIDLEYYEKAKKIYERAIENISNNIYKIVGYKFNINSQQELIKIFEKLNFPIVKTTKISENPSTDKEALSKLKEETNHPLLDYLLAYSRVEKIYNTYLMGISKAVVNGKIHGRLHTTTTVTDRLSATEPNQQNVATNKHIKKMICADNGYLFIYGDLKQAEVRMFAYISKDESLMEACISTDIYKTMASRMFKININNVTDRLRQFTKGMVLGILYGMGDDSLAIHLKTSKKEAIEIHQAFFKAFPKAKNFIDSTVEFVHKNSYVRGIFGSLRRFPKINNDTEANIAKYERQAVNYIIQNATANFVKRSLIRIDNSFKDFDGGIVITVHDSVLCEIANSQLKDFASVFAKNLTDPVFSVNPAMAIDLKVGNNWWDLKKYEL